MDSQKQSPSNSLFQTKFERAKNGNLEVYVTIPWKVVEESYQTALAKVTDETTLKGFRKGKAPKKQVEQTIGQQKIYEKMVPELLTEAYVAALKNHQLKPIVNPRFQLVKAEDKSDWELKAITAELPKVELGNYKTDLKKELAAEQIWVPGKDEKEKDQEEDAQQKIGKTFQALIKAVKFDIPELIIEEEVTRLLSRLVDQTAKLGITVDQYLQSIGKTNDQLKTEYRRQAEEAIRLELILAAIAEAEKFTVSDQEVAEMIEASGDEKVKTQLQKPDQQAYLRQILRKRKVIDMLSSL